MSILPVSYVAKGSFIKNSMESKRKCLDKMNNSEKHLLCLIVNNAEIIMYPLNVNIELLII